MEFKLDEEQVNAIIRKIKSLEDRFAKNATRRALRKAAAPIREEAKRKAMAFDNELTREAIYKNLAVFSGSRRRERQEGGTMVRLGVRGGSMSKTKESKKKRAKRKAAGKATLKDLGEIEGKGKGNPGGDTFYWRFLEFGTSKMPAKPFLRASLEAKKDEAKKEIVSSLERELEEEVKKRT